LTEEPGSCQRPEAVGGAAAEAQGFGRLLMGQAGEVTQLDEPGRLGSASNSIIREAKENIIRRAYFSNGT
jgi:hypothetical protein